MKILRTLVVWLIVSLGLAALASAQIGAPGWQTLRNPPTFITDTALVLTDGTVMVHEYCTSNWHRLTPDNRGSYVNGTWSTLASMPANYGPLYFASGVLPDGRVLVEGGEYNFCQGAETAQGAIYDPVMNTWTNVNPPMGWTEIGDAPSVILSDGTFMLGQSGYLPSNAAAFFNATNLTWTIRGSGKADGFLEEGMELLPNGMVLVVDTQDVPNSEVFNPGSSIWSSAGSTIVDLVSPFSETGPALLRPDGTVFAMGASVRGGAGHTAIFNTGTATWEAGPDFPNYDATADAPAAVLPNGDVLVETSPPGTAAPRVPVSFYVFHGTEFLPAPSPHNTGSGGGDVAFTGRLLVLPTGQILFTLADGASMDAEIYTPGVTFQQAWAPTIKIAPIIITRGNTYQIAGTQFNGLTQGAAYGDDAQMSSNYPLVRVTNNATKHVAYARTHDHSSMGVQTGPEIVSTHFDVPETMETGASSLVVVANGIPSQPISVTVR